MTSSITAPNAPADKASARRSLPYRRALLILQLAGSSLGVLGLLWIVANLVLGFSSLLLVLDVVLVVAGVAVVWLARRHRIRQAGAVLYLVTFSLLCVFSIWLDIPTPEVPRSIHSYFLVLGVSAYLVFHAETKPLRIAVPFLCFSGFILFDSTGFGVPSALIVPETVRVYGIWVNNVTAIALMFVMINIMQADLIERDALETDFRHAIEHHELELHYQAQADVNGHIVGAEALMRWRHPRQGLILPDVFIPVAERSGLIYQAGHWAIETACWQLVQWQGHAPMDRLTVAVNVSAAQLRRDDFVADVLQIIQTTRVPVRRLKLELTESILIHDIDSVIAKMAALKAHGVGFSLDDFGTGYSSLSHLKRLPLDQLKIDGAFVRDVLTDPHAAAIAHTIVHLGQTLGLQVIAEGVETQGQKQFLINSECRTFQGYLIGRPLPAAAFEALVHDAL